MNIRHNNIDPTLRKCYREYVATMSKNDLEIIYDDTYQSILLAELLLDNVGRSDAIADLKKIVNPK